ncbi:hypothetical protein Hbl1158_14600 [Halobaculum sp. CBA1158]|uniref:DUF7529 family protein n=1 Tax=Halobaculum sp. CBA1158 TaxID=2904243 RepID=UPI001F2599FE|nr:hypothetical protein [Halobaculum sp. CBA1158]UIO99732.1 hypothetical protein Hbl1158_14600 [Halobaculum sp. CBA1158]
MAGSHPLAGFTDFWDDVMADMEATAEEYRESGWDVTELHPGDVTPLPNASTAGTGVEAERLGFDVLLPGDEFETVQETVAGVEDGFDEYDAYRAQRSNVVFLVVAMKAEAAGTAVVFPLYYSQDQAEPLLDRAERAGELHTYLRPLDDSERVVFTQREPDALFPEGGDSDSLDGDAAE